MKKEKIFISLLTEKLYWVLELRINCSKSSHLTLAFMRGRWPPVKTLRKWAINGL